MHSICVFLIPDIRYSDISFTEKDRIGDGGQGAVYKAFWNPKNFNVAIKVLLAISNAGKREVSHFIVNLYCNC